MYNILVVHPESSYGGSSKSILELLDGLPNNYQVHFLCPPGDSSSFFSERGYKIHNVIGVPQFNNTKYGFYSGFRWLILLRELFYFVPFLFALIKLRKNYNFHVIHCNEITCVISGIIIKFFYKQARFISHVRSLQNSSNLRHKIINKLIQRHFDSLIFIDEAVKRTCPSLEGVIIHNTFSRLNDFQKVHSKRFRVALIGVLHPMKGVFEFVNACRLLKKYHKHIDFYVVGKNSRDFSSFTFKVLEFFGLSIDVNSKVLSLKKRYNLDNLNVIGFVDDIKKFYPSIDLVCFPSYLDAPGRPIIEAAAYGLPSVLCMENPTNDVFIKDKTSIILEKPTASDLSAAIERLYKDKPLYNYLSKNSIDHFDNFLSPTRQRELLLTLYQSQVDYV